MDDSADVTDRLLLRAADRLTGHHKRLFQAEVAVALCGGSARRAERRFGWGRDAVGTGLRELASGIRCVDNFAARGRVRMEDADPRLAADIRDVVEPRTHTDPELKTDRRYHDPPPARRWTPLGILVVATGALSLFFGPRETSDLWADGLERWWGQVRGGLRHVRRLVVYLDNGPNCSGTRTQFLRRMVGFADASGLVVRLVYYPPYHSKYNPVERCWSSLERKWRGGLLTSLGVIPG